MVASANLQLAPIYKLRQLRLFETVRNLNSGHQFPQRFDKVVDVIVVIVMTKANSHETSQLLEA